jgi:hypothetical protein
MSLPYRASEKGGGLVFEDDPYRRDPAALAAQYARR